MNIGEKISLYKERLKFKNYQEFGKAAGVSGSWILDLSKKQEISVIDITNLIKLCDYLSITIDQLLKDEEKAVDQYELKNSNPDDICVKIYEIKELLEKDEIKLNGKLLSGKAKEILKDALDISIQLMNQYL